MRRLFKAALLLLFAVRAYAHAPFDASTRVVVHSDSLEVMITTGSSLAEKFFEQNKITSRPALAGRLTELPASTANFFLEATSQSANLPPQSMHVLTDGAEFEFAISFPLRSERTLFHSHYLEFLSAPKASPFVVTDENGNVISSTILSPRSDVAEIVLPEKIFPENSISQAVATNLPPAGVAQNNKPHPKFWEFLKLGICHILNIKAFDHLLFLIALLLGCRRLKTMLLVVTGFTLAHSLTLALAALDVVTISSKIIEPAIAASIIFVAVENFYRSEKSWHRCALTCGFGFIHGFGFASALRESGLGKTGGEIAMPLFAFNLGVEIGQLAVVAIVLPILFVLQKNPGFNRYGVRTVSSLIILLATFWFFERVTSLGY